MAEIQSVRIHHEMILTWLIANPDKTQGQCALEFNVTEAWLSTVINSDVFQARWHERRQAMADGMDGQLMASAKTVALKALARLDKIVDTVPDPELLLSTTDKLLGRLGFGPKTAGMPVAVQTNVHVSVNAELLAEARKRITAKVPGQTIEALPAPEAAQVEIPMPAAQPVQISRSQDS